MPHASVFQWILLGLYSLGALIGFLNLALMTKPIHRAEVPKISVLIPARNEEENLKRLLPSLLAPNDGLGVWVFDDESSDGTGSVVSREGATLVLPSEPLPTGWTGKNRACDRLAAAVADLDSEWILFLDADVYPEPDFIPRMKALCNEVDPDVGMITGFPTIIPGQGIEPLFLAWVGWALLTSTPYGLISRSRKGHGRFKNGQVHCWRKGVYLQIRPNEQVKDRIMEDVQIARLLAKKGIRVEVANLSSILSVKMYDNWRQTLDGMSKNSFEITGSDLGSVLVALLFLVYGWGWLFCGALLLPSLVMLLLAGLSVALIVRTSLWPGLLMPVVPTIGAFTIIRSMIWHRRGTVLWKGRIYPGTSKH